MCIRDRIWPVLAMWGAYLAVDILMSVTAVKGKPFYMLELCLPVLFLMPVSYTHLIYRIIIRAGF